MSYINELQEKELKLKCLDIVSRDKNLLACNYIQEAEKIYKYLSFNKRSEELKKAIDKVIDEIYR